MENGKNIFNVILNNQEKSIFKIYEFLNKEIFNKNYNLNQNNNINILLKYLRFKDEKILSNIWGNFSIQKELFLLIIELCENFLPKIDVKEEDIKNFLIKFQDKYVVSPLLAKYSYEIKKLFYSDSSEKYLKICSKRKNFEFYYLKTNDESITELNSSDVFFHIILDGVVEINKNQLLSRGDVYFSKELPLKEKFLSITPSYSKIIFVIKSNFLKTSSIEILKTKNQKFYLPIVNFIEEILLKTPNEMLDDFILLQIATYLIEFHNNNHVDLYEIPYLKYKKIIIDIIKNNIFLERKAIVNKLLEVLDISLSKLYNIFYYLFDMPINKYIDKIKMDKACYLLSTTNYSTTNISMKLNISEQAFISKFTKHLTYTPNNFRKMLEER